MAETVRSRFIKVLNGQMPEDRLPLVEWAGWWDKTLARWQDEGLDPNLSGLDIKRHFGLDTDCQHWFPQILPGVIPYEHKGHGKGWIESEAEYDRLKPFIYPDPVVFDRNAWKHIAAMQQAGEVVVWISWYGYFWWPRTLFGIEGHLYAFYDYPDLMHRIIQDQLDYHKKCLEQFCEVCTPDFLTFGEDMSYNHGPMISKDSFYEFLTPYYRQITPLIREKGIIPMIDSDGGIEPLIPWFKDCGLDGILPLERMANVDVNRIRQNHPEWIMIGGFDKMVMHLGEEAIRNEFERLLPAMRSGRFIPSVDHQTPPGVSLADYYIYLRVFREYAAKAVA